MAAQMWKHNWEAFHFFAVLLACLQALMNAGGLACAKSTNCNGRGGDFTEHHKKSVKLGMVLDY